MAKKKAKACFAKLSPKAMALAFAILCGIDCFLLALLPALKSEFLWWNSKILALFMLPGISASIGGAVIALIWGIVIGLVFGWLLAFLYNWAICKCK